MTHSQRQQAPGRVRRLRSPVAVLVALAMACPPRALGLAVLDGVHPAAGPIVTNGQEARLQSITYEERMVKIRVDKDVLYRVFTLSHPPRIVVELPRTMHGSKPYEAAVKDGVLNRIRSAQFRSAPEMITRIVLDLSRLVPYRAVREGDGIVVRFEGSEAGPAGTASADTEEPLEGQAEERLDSAAVTRVGASGGRGPRDLLGSLPKNPITIDFDEADIRDVIRVLSEMSGVNMIYASDLRGFVTIHLDRVPFDEVFNTVLTTQGLVAHQIGNNIIRILTPAALTTDRGNSVTTYRTFLLNYGLASEIQTHLGAVRISPQAKVTVDDRNNALVVTDTPEGLAAAERLISELDRKPPQVLIETKIVQIDLNRALDIGIQWEYANNTLSDANNARIIGSRIQADGNTAPAGTRTGLVTTDATGAEVTTGAGIPDAGGTGVNLPGPLAAGISFGLFNNSEILTAQLRALETTGETKTLTNPKVITTNNQLARIQIGSQVPIRSTTVSGTGLATETTNFVSVGFIIDVTPTINVDNRIRLKVAPTVSEVASVSTQGDPTINTTTAQTEVILKDGETLVIGGLVSEKMIEAATKVPLLGDLPVLGVFFRSTKDQKTRQEILIFVTARVVPD